MLQSFEEGISYSRKGRANVVSIKVHSKATKSLYLNLGALVLAVIVGQLFRMYLPDSIGTFINTNLFTPVKDIFMNMLNLIVVPVVFFSIASCVGSFSNLSDLGRIGGKSIALYMFTSVMAIGSALLAYFILPPIVDGIDVGSAVVTEVSTVELSLVDTIVGIVPSNIMDPFVNADMLQLIFLGLLIGVGTTMLGEQGKPLSNFIELLNELFIKIMGVFIKFMPFATFATVASVVWSLGIGIMISLMGLIACFVLGLCLIAVVYSLLIVVLAKKNPLPLFRKIPSLLVTAFALSSSNATLPTTMDTCEHKLGIDSKVSSFTLALGATMNMDGTCIYTMVASLFLANVYGIEVTVPMLVSLCGVVLALSVGMPGMPGSGLIAISMAAVQLGLPPDAIGLVVGIDRLGGMLRTMSNVLGDVSVTTVVAQSEGLLDEAVYKQ
ncbi:MAG: dicarboxylate/amino acid:cation symporter [Eubacteriales bacterium]